MKRLKIMVPLLLVLFLSSSLFIGYASQNTKGETSLFKDHMDITIAFWDIQTMFKDGVKDEIYDRIAKKLNITIKPVNITWADYKDKINVWAASGQLPDVFAVDNINTISYNNWIKQGVVRALPANLSKYPSLAKTLNSPDIDSLKQNGKLYCIPRLCYENLKDWPADRGMLVRKDWMEKAGIKQDPKNLDEFISMVKTIMDKDPEGRGKGSFAGVTFNGADLEAYFMLAYNPDLTAACTIPGGNWIQEDGRFIPALVSKKTLDGLKAYRKMYDADIIDNDFAALKGDVARDKFASGRAFIIADVVNARSGNLPKVKQKFQKNYPEKKFEDCVKIMDIWPANDGNRYRFLIPSYWSESYLSAKVNDKKADRIMALFNYLLSDEGKNLVRLGIENKDYKKNGDKIEITRPKNDDGTFKMIAEMYPCISSLGFLASWDNEWGFYDPAGDPALQSMVNNYVKKAAVEDKDTNPNFKLDYLMTPLREKFVFQNPAEIIMNIMLKKDDVEKLWNDVLKDLNAKGLQQMIAEVNKTAKEKGVIKTK